MKKLSFIIMALVVAVMTSCSSRGLNAKKCEELTQKGVENLTNSDLEFLIDQLEIATERMSDPELIKNVALEAEVIENRGIKDSDIKISDFALDESKVLFATGSLLSGYIGAKGELPSKMQERFETVSRKAAEVLEQTERR